MEKTRLLKLRALACLMGLGVSGCAFLDKQILNDHLTKAKITQNTIAKKKCGLSLKNIME